MQSRSFKYYSRSPKNCAERLYAISSSFGGHAGLYHSAASLLSTEAVAEVRRQVHGVVPAFANAHTDVSDAVALLGEHLA